jgi:hypothetical protein
MAGRQGRSWVRGGMSGARAEVDKWGVGRLLNRPIRLLVTPSKSCVGCTAAWQLAGVPKVGSVVASTVHPESALYNGWGCSPPSSATWAPQATTFRAYLRFLRSLAVRPARLPAPARVIPATMAAALARPQASPWIACRSPLGTPCSKAWRTNARSAE